jgi:tryptophan synthase alpha chain
MSNIDKLFQQLKAEKKKAFIPFVTAGDPSLEFTAATIRELAKRGASLIEIGFPYSDPIADGPVIQASYTRALAKKITVAQIFSMVKNVVGDIACPLVGMVSYAIIFRHGPEQFVADAKAAGLSGLIVPDLLVEEADRFAQICRAADLSLILLATPTTPPERAVRIAKAASGFLYFVSITGITGERTELPPDLTQKVSWLRSQTTLPICIGFGISRPEHVQLLAPVADGLIVGSAIVKRMAAAETESAEGVLKEIGDYVAGLMAAM